MVCAIAGGVDDYDTKDPSRGRFYVACGFGAILILLSVIRALHNAPGSSLPPPYCNGPFYAAVGADIVQVIFGAVLIALPIFFDEKQLSSVQLVSQAAVFAVINVVANLGVRVLVDRAEEAANRAETRRAAAEHRPAKPYSPSEPLLTDVTFDLASRNT